MWGVKPSFEMLVSTFEAFNHGGRSYGGKDIFLDYEAFTSSHMFLDILFGGFLIYGLIRLFRKYAIKKYYVYFLVCWMVLPLCVLFIINFVYFPRYALISLPAYYIVIAVGIDGVQRRKRKIAAVCAVCILIMEPLYIYYSTTLKRPWKEVVSCIETRSTNEDVIIVVPSKLIQLFGFYNRKGARYCLNEYDQCNDLLRQNYAMLKGPYIKKQENTILIGINNIKQIKDLIDNGYVNSGNIKLVLAHDHYEDIKRYLNRYYSEKEKIQYSGIEIIYLSSRFSGRSKI